SADAARRIRDISVFARRPPHAHEDPLANLGPEGEANSDPSQNRYRRISDMDDHFTLSVAAGNVEWIYGILALTPHPHFDYSGLSISVVFVGASKTEWNDGLNPSGQTNTFCEIESVLIRDGDNFKVNSTDPILLPFVIPIRTHPESGGLPISFKSPSATIHYFIQFKFYFRGIKGFFSYNEVVVPVRVDDGIRVIFDSSGNRVGNVSLVRNTDSISVQNHGIVNDVDQPDKERSPNAAERLVLSQPRMFPDSYSAMMVARDSLEQDYGLPDYSPPSSMHSSSRQIEEAANSAPIPSSPPLAYSTDDPHPNSIPYLSLDSSSERPQESNSSTHLPLIILIIPPRLLNSLFRRAPGIPSGDIPSGASAVSPPSTASLPPLKEAPASASVLPSPPLSPPRQSIERTAGLFSSSLDGGVLRLATSSSTQSSPSLLRSFSEMTRRKSRVLLWWTIFHGPGRIPVDIFIKSLPLGHTIKEIQIRLNAVVSCIAHGVIKTDTEELANVDITSGFDGACYDCVDTGVWKQRVWLEVPDSEKLGQYATAFSAPLVRLKHRVTFRLLTEKKRRVLAASQGIYNLGSISVVLLRT
ncbi:hypothetical protein BCR33DRAFT_724273, partial [Rhizoclosmatium globosum]